ncbi:MAG: hypothetical protein EAZ53_16395 [Bacteroidetes bacterium]|nr:MAG: hypothetical protein EAZ53_16395 [Bacteroidota bacterium]
MNKNSSKQIALSKKLRRLYIIALLAVAIFSIIGQIMIQYAISEQQNDATVINLAGRQRMISQRICKNILLLSKSTNFFIDTTLYINDLKEIIPLWRDVHLGLRNKVLENKGKKIIVKNSEKIDSMIAVVHPIFLTMISNAKYLLYEIENTNSPDRKMNMKAAISSILENEFNFLKTMDKIVFQYDAEAKDRISKLKIIELFLFFLTVLILIIEGFFIFRPLYHQVSDTILTLVKSEDNLYGVNLQLKSTNESLIATENQLLKTQEEKFKLQLQEGKIRSASLIEGQEAERKRIAFELHDGIGQMLTGLKLTAERIKISSLESEKEQKALIDLKQLLDSTMAETRTISFNLTPSVLDDFGIYSAIKILVDNASKNTNITFLLEFPYNFERYSTSIEITLYRIIQEAINNCLKYAEATTINLSITKSDDYILLIISDNGKGFDRRKLKTKIVRNGIRNMQARTELNNGEFKIISKIGKGTKILVKLPLS